MFRECHNVVCIMLRSHDHLYIAKANFFNSTHREMRQKRRIMDGNGKNTIRN